MILTEDPKKKVLALRLVDFWFNWGWRPNKMKKTRSSPQISGVMVSHRNTVSPQNGFTRGGPSP